MNLKVTQEEASKLGKKFNINFKVIPFAEWVFGLNVELEHGSRFGKMTNVTNNKLNATAMIAMAHLIEDPRYYYYLKRMESSRERYWIKKAKPSIFKLK